MWALIKQHGLLSLRPPISEWGFALASYYQSSEICDDSYAGIWFLLLFNNLWRLRRIFRVGSGKSPSPPNQISLPNEAMCWFVLWDIEQTPSSIAWNPNSSNPAVSSASSWPGTGIPCSPRRNRPKIYHLLQHFQHQSFHTSKIQKKKPQEPRTAILNSLKPHPSYFQS